MRHMRKRRLSLIAIISLISIIYLLFAHEIARLHLVYAAELYERKSISFFSQILMPNTIQIPQDKIARLTTVINKQIGMPRFDYNPLQESLQTQFWSELYESPAMQALGAIKVSVDRLGNSALDLQERIAHLDQQIYALDSAGKDASKYRVDKATLQKEYTELSANREKMLVDQKKAEDDLFKQVEELLTKKLAPELFKILSDPELQRLRAQEYVSEEDRKKFIVEKAKELGITSEDLEKVMSSAYLYIIFLTDYDRSLVKDQKTEKRTVTYYLSGGVAWFKFVVLEDQVSIEALKIIRTDESASADPDTNYPFSSLDGDTGAFVKASEGLAEKLKLETLNIDDFALKTGLVEVSGSKVRFPLGKKEGIFVDQKFRVYEKEKHGERIIEKKRGFFYVDKIGDNISNKDELSHGKLVIRGAEPGMQIREFSNTGIDVSLRLSAGQIKIEPGDLQTSGYSLNIEKDFSAPIYALNLTVQYDVGRNVQIPQSFFTVGGDVGLLMSTDGISIQPYNKEPELPLYFDVYAGFMKKLYIRRIALCFEPLIQYQSIMLSHTEDKDTVRFDSGTVSLLPKVGIEFAIREDVNIGFTVGSSVPILSTNEWSGKYSSAKGTAVDLAKDIIGPEVTYPKTLLGFYVSYCLPKYW